MKSHWIIGAVRRLVTFATAISLCIAIGRSAGPGVMGRVLGVDEGGKLLGTVPGAKIELKGGGTTTSDGTGRYKIDLPPGTYPYKLTAAGYKDEDSGRGVQLQLSEGYAVFNFTLTKGKTDPEKKTKEQPEIKSGRLKGRVYEKTEKGDVGIGGAVVALRRQGGQGLTRVVTRGADSKGAGAGHYGVGLQEGEWRASVNAHGYEQFVDPKAIQITAGDEAVRDFVLRKETPSTDQGITGVIRVEQGDGPLLPMSGIRLRILQVPGEQVAVGPHSPDGKGQFRKALGVGLYRVVAEAKGFKTARSRPTHVFKGRYSKVDLTLVREGRKPPGEMGLDVVVMDAATRKVIRGAEVLVRLGDRPLSEALRGQTGPDGEVGLKIPGDGDYTALARAEGYAPGGKKFSFASGKPSHVEILLQRKGVAETAIVEQPPTRTQPVPPVPPVVPMPPTGVGQGVLTVQVIERSGAPVAGARVSVMMGGVRVQTGATDRMGVWQGNIHPGSYAVKALKEGYGSGGTGLEMGARDENVRIQLARTESMEPGQEPRQELTLAIQVLERGGGPISGASVVTMSGRSRAASGMTDRSGWWRGQVEGRTTYQVKASKLGFSTGGAVVSVGTSDAMQQVTLMRLRQPESQPLIIPQTELPKKPPTRRTPTPGQLTPQKITPMVITPLQPQTIKRTRKDEKVE